MSFLRSTISAVPRASAFARAYQTSAETKIIGRITKTETFQTANSNGFRYTIAVENASSARKDSVWLPYAERTSSFFEVSCFGKMADSMVTKFEKIPNGSLVAATANIELKKGTIPGTVSTKTGGPIQTERAAFYHERLDILSLYDPEVSAIRKELAASRNGGQQQQQQQQPQQGYQQQQSYNNNY